MKQDLLHKKQFLEVNGVRSERGESYLSPSLHFYLDGSDHTVIKTSCHLIFCHTDSESKENQARFGPNLSKMWRKIEQNPGKHRKLVYGRFLKTIWPRKVFTLYQDQIGYHMG